MRFTKWASDLGGCALNDINFCGIGTGLHEIYAIARKSDVELIVRGMLWADTGRQI